MILTKLMGVFGRIRKHQARSELMRYYQAEYPHENIGFLKLIANEQLRSI